MDGAPIREWARRRADAPARIEIVTEDGAVFACGRAVVRDISFTGALLTEIELDGLPAKWFRVRLTFDEGFRALARPVRIEAKADFALAVEFEDFGAGDAP